MGECPPSAVYVILNFKELSLDLVRLHLGVHTYKILNPTLVCLLSRQRTPPHPGRRCLDSTTTRRRPRWCRLSPKRPRSSATLRCVGSNANQMRGRGTGRAGSMLSMETVRYAHLQLIQLPAILLEWSHVNAVWGDFNVYFHIKTSCFPYFHIHSCFGQNHQ